MWVFSLCTGLSTSLMSASLVNHQMTILEYCCNAATMLQVQPCTPLPLPHRPLQRQGTQPPGACRRCSCSSHAVLAGSSGIPFAVRPPPPPSPAAPLTPPPPPPSPQLLYSRVQRRLEQVPPCGALSLRHAAHALPVITLLIITSGYRSVGTVASGFILERINAGACKNPSDPNSVTANRFSCYRHVAPAAPPPSAYATFFAVCACVAAAPVICLCYMCAQSRKMKED
jgi:hypothetical protein